MGNVRVSFDKGPSGSARVIQEDEYYSFGLRKLGGYFLSNDNRYLYNGKEIQADLDNQYDYGARFYDPVIGRWNSIDPLAEISRRFSTYHYGQNNPVSFIDVDGMWYWKPNDGNLYAEKGDNAQTLADFWHVDLETAVNTMQNLANWNDGGLMKTGLGDVEGKYLSAGVQIGSFFGAPITVEGQTMAANPRDPDNLRASGYGDGPVNMQDMSLPSTSQAIGQNVVNTYSAVEGVFALRAALTAVKGFNSFAEFKAAHGVAGDGMAWHHIVEQNPTNIETFGANAIHTEENLVKLEHGAGSIHAKISGYYSSKQPFTNGLTVRQWLNSQTYQQQYDFGIKILKQFGGTL